ncbi:MAG TPA: DUF1134 domain-containing protein [Methyloceanibacter sp.]|jgi:hypothetical protein|nr:DUF1134 domain-containing protein [Methyloceanibacter sp.]
MKIGIRSLLLLSGLLVAAPILVEDQTPAAAKPTIVAQADGPMVITPKPPSSTYQGASPQAGATQRYNGGSESGAAPGAPYHPYVPPDANSKGTFTLQEIKDSGGRFFGKVSMGFAHVVEYAFQRAGQPNGYILGEEAGGAFIAGLRYGEGTLYTKDAGTFKVYWQGPSLGYDFGGDGSRTMVLVYNLQSPSDIFDRYAGVDGSAYFIGGVGVTFLSNDHVTLAPISSGVGLRLGANVGYLKYTREPTWNPF